MTQQKGVFFYSANNYPVFTEVRLLVSRETFEVEVRLLVSRETFEKFTCNIVPLVGIEPTSMA